MKRRACMLAVALTPFVFDATAQTWPSRPITIIVPQSAGSYSDNMIRPVAAALQELLGQPVIIDNKPGANGIIGADAAARAKPDGYTLLLSASSVFVSNAGLYKKLAYDPIKDFRSPATDRKSLMGSQASFLSASSVFVSNAGLYKKLAYDPIKDFRSVAGLSKTAMMFVARPDFPARSLDEMLAQARNAGKPLNVAVGSSTARLALSLLSSASDVPFNAVPYKGSPQAITDLLGGVVPVAVVDMASGTAFVKSGRVNAVATTDSERNAFLPDVPTLAERYPGATLVSWTGLSAPAGTPDEAVRVLHEAVRKSLADPEVRQRLATSSITPSLMTSEALDRAIREDTPRWTTLMRAAGIQAE